MVPFFAGAAFSLATSYFFYWGVFGFTFLVGTFLGSVVFYLTIFLKLFFELNYLNLNIF